MPLGRLAALSLLLGSAAPAAAELPVPPLTGPVVDRVGVLDDQWRERLAGLSRAARAEEGGNGPQLQYLLVRSLEGEPIESYSMRVAESWKLGTKGKDNGVLVVVALDDRRVRIEVGGGIEGGLTDVQSVHIIRNSIAPAFRAGRYGEGLYAAGRQILAALGALPEGAAEPAARPVHVSPVVGGLLGALFGLGAPGFVFLFILFFVVVRILGGLGRGRRGPWDRWGGPGVGGGGSWGGGGGWSGGGGGFSGGGASGSW